MSTTPTVTKIKPDQPGGFVDYFGTDQVARLALIQQVSEVYSRFGFAPLDTPEVEFQDVLTGEGGSDFRIYDVSLPSGRSTDLNEKRAMALRFDLTVPLARFAASRINSLPRPFKRQQFGPVFRGESSSVSSGRFNRFFQLDADIVWCDSLVSDAEIIALINATLSTLGIERFTIRVNNRKILNGLAEEIACRNATELFRNLDKLEKVGWDEIETLLRRQPDNEWDDTALALDDAQVQKCREFVDILTLEQTEAFFATSRIGQEGVTELKEIFQYLESFGVPSTRYKYDPSIARGLGYYTGTIFEAYLDDLPTVGSVMSGGRYDDLLMRFTGESAPATGVSIGIDRLLVALRELKVLGNLITATESTVIAILDPELFKTQLQAATLLRDAGITTDIFLGDMGGGIKNALAYALKQEATFLVIIGSNEAEQGIVQVKNLHTRQQTPVPLADIATHIRSLLS